MKPKYRNLLLATLFLTAASVVQAQDAPNWKYQEGVHYDRLVPVQGTSSPPDKIEVAEFFWYGCLYCYRMEAYIEEWQKDQPDEVNFIHIPAPGDPTMETHARLFLALQAVGELDAAHRDVFRAIHTESRGLLAARRTRSASRGATGSRPRTTATPSGRFSVESGLRRIKDLMRRYRILAVPAFVVNGKYVVRVTPDSDMPQLLEIVDELVARELTER